MKHITKCPVCNGEGKTENDDSSAKYKTCQAYQGKGWLTFHLKEDNNGA